MVVFFRPKDTADPVCQVLAIRRAKSILEILEKYISNYLIYFQGNRKKIVYKKINSFLHSILIAVHEKVFLFLTIFDRTIEIITFCENMIKVRQQQQQQSHS